jgi:DNA polymerase
LAQTERSAGLPDAPASLELLRSQLDGCTRCKLHLKRNHIVFGEGAENAELIFVGEGPGADEDASGRPFVGAAGQLMDRIIGAMGLNRERIFIGNVVKCRPPGNRDPEPDEISTCRPFLLQQIAYIRPKLIVTWGRVASHALLGVRTPITHMRGKWQSLYGIDLMPTLHPSYLLRQPEAKKLVWQDMQAVLARLGLPVPERKRRES